MKLDMAVTRIDLVLSAHPDVAVRIAWRVVRGAARRGRRITAKTLPRVADVAQHAIAVRELLDQLTPALPPVLFGVALAARDHTLAIISAASTAPHPDDSDPGEPDE